MANETDPSTQVALLARGDVTGPERRYAEEKIGELRRLVDRPVLSARAELTSHPDPARARPAFAKAELDLDGHHVRAHAAGTTMFEAIDLLESRLRERLDRAAARERSRHLRFRGGDEHEWRHAQYSEPRAAWFPRPVDEREIVRHKSFAPGMLTPDDAALDLELLDHDFYLFANAETGEDNVIARSERGGYELFEPSASCSLVERAVPISRSPIRPVEMGIDEARDILDLGDQRFQFFVDPADHRGRVLYRRYDGHYGLIVPSDRDAA